MSDKLIDGPTQASSSQNAASGGSSGASAQASSSEPLAVTYLFSVKIDGTIVGVFTECSGIAAKRHVETFREGGVNDFAHQMAGPMEYENIVLKRGLSTSNVLWTWFESGKYDFAVTRHDITIVQEAPGAGSSGFGVVKTWTVNRAFPISWRISELNTATSSAVIETLELAHEGISLQS
jgi:phage tail-like protein